MSASVRGLILLLVLTFCLSGCKIELTEVPRDTPAHLSMVIIAEDQANRLRLQASLNPGRDAEARVRPVTSDLVVQGQPIAPSEANTWGAYAYGAEWSLSAQLQENAPLSIRAPEIAGIPAPPRVYEAQLPRRLGPAALQVVPRDPIVLPLERGASAVENARWHLEAVDERGSRLLRIQSEGLPPAQIVLSSSWLPSPLPSSLEISVVVWQTVRSDLVEGQYALTLTIQSHLSWTVSWSARNEASPAHGL